ncbi:pimeloyl-[acyl-carrier protein] methyl ester esterase [Arenicella chitinivorans]|uniref:Pimeloyl-[acyl-carrier protein] methyl ester esterase n=1 Tax=Arenicella chitinivorans TaxID=1329800 RepID=A0A918RR74_9GAMM|nr:alpha/beta fold hydrolase [Arenicella chitinivorans]GHA06112.1 pimeloyl-[acyl-carrier protein] methyl ester esterase [Arenicella chitinivorans]
MSEFRDVVLVHGWGLNSAVWVKFSAALSEMRPELRIHHLDLPGYGSRIDSALPNSFESLAEQCRKRVPDNAIWVGWSLGGMLALEAALQAQPSVVTGLVLIGASAKFVESDDWRYGVQLATFHKFADALGRDYCAMLERFLLMQTGSVQGARDQVRQIVELVSGHPAPALATLRWGLECLERVDLRDRLSELAIPARVISGRLDRVAHPEAGMQLARALRCPYVELHSGHAPFLSHQREVIDVVHSLIVDVKAAERSRV